MFFDCKKRGVFSMTSMNRRRHAKFLLSCLFTAVIVLAAGSLHAEKTEILWKYEPPAGYVDASPAVADLTGDGHADLVIGTTAGLVIALTSGGEEIWRHEMQGPISVSPSIGDLNNCAGDEVVVMNRLGTIHCLSAATGTFIWEQSLPAPLQWGETVLAIADLDNDGKLEIVTGNSSSTVVCLNGDGEIVWQYKGDHGITQAPALADLNNDGFLEVLVSGNVVPLVCLSHEGEELWRLENAIGSNPLVYDLDGDHHPEILIGCGSQFRVIDGNGKERWSYPMQREMDGALTVVDADGDGEVEIYLIDLSGNLVSLNPEGRLRWQADVKERVRRSPTVGDVDGDGVQEIIVAGYDNTMYIFEPDGRLDTKVPVQGGTNCAVTLLPLQNGKPGLLVAPNNQALSMHCFSDAQANVPLLWPEYLYDSQRNGAGTKAAQQPTVEFSLTYGERYVGVNLMEIQVDNPDGRNLHIELTSQRDHDAPAVSALSTNDKDISLSLSYTLPANKATNLTLSAVIKEGDKVLEQRNQKTYVVPFSKELADLERSLSDSYTQIARLADTGGFEERNYFLQGKLQSYRERVQQLSTATDGEIIDLRNDIRAYLTEVNALNATVAAAAQAGANGKSLLLSSANPWAPFGGFQELAEGRMNDEPITIEAFSGETESAALNLFNLTNMTRSFRVELEALRCGDAEVPARDCITLHEVIAVPTEMRDFSADAIPLLNKAQLIQISPWSAAQIWLNVDTKPLAAGEWTASLVLRSLDVESICETAPINIHVWAPQLPETQPLSLCHWGYVHSSVLKDYPEEALQDQVRNGTNVFVGTFFPRATYDEQGEIIGAIDFTDHDSYVTRHAPHGTILFFNYQHALKGPGGQNEEAYAKAHLTWLRAWVAHLKELGVGYDGFALYPVDEPGLNDGLVEIHQRMAKLAREADPNILMYTDPVARITEDELKEMLPYVDIWCPNRDGLILEKTNKAKLDIIKASGKQIWTYACEPNAKHQSPLGYYRGQAWLAWQHGLTGIGFWSYCTSRDDPWFLPSLRHDYLMVYPGDGVVSSKRWEAVRDGIEDYSMLHLLRSLVDNAPDAMETEALDKAHTLLNEKATVIGEFCGVDQDGTVPGTDGLAGARRISDKRWETIRTVRRELAELLTQLNTAANVN
jgi:outer membrane protein assembly factor BamB